MDMQPLTQLTLAFELTEQGLSHTKIAVHLGRHRETIGLWLKDMENYGLAGFLDRHTQAKKGPRRARQVPARIKRLIWELRVREHDCCGQKIAYFLEREYQVRLSVPKIYEVLAEKYVIRSKWRKNQKRGLCRQRCGPGQSSRWIPWRLDISSPSPGSTYIPRRRRWCFDPHIPAMMAPPFCEPPCRDALRGRVEVLQTDGGPELKGAFATQARTYCERHRIARSHKKNERAYIENFNRTLRKECLGWGTYRTQDLVRLIPEVHTFLERYRYHRPHMGFSPMRPPLRTPLTQEEELSDIYEDIMRGLECCPTLMAS